MREQRTTLGPVFAVALAGVACGHAEQGLVDRYFAALKGEDNVTLSTMAVMPFKHKVDRWSITNAAEEARHSVPLAEHVAKVATIEKAIEQNKDDGRAFRDQSPDEWAQVELLKRDAAVPAKLQSVKAKYDEVLRKDRELRNELAAAKTALQKEKQEATLSMTLPVDEIERQHGALETLSGDLVTKELDLALTIDGQEKPYRMTLKKYELKTPKGTTLPSRWVIFGLAPKA